MVGEPVYRNLNMEFPSHWLELLTEIADRADEIALRFFRARDLPVDAKSDGSPVSAADRAIEEMARVVARKHFPTLGVFGEEEGDAPGRSAQRLIIDPIDGTRNFVRGIPIFATLLAIEDGDDVVAGMVSAPALRSRWSAARGHGAYQADRRLQVSSVASLERAQLFHGDVGATREPHPPTGMFAMIRQVERTRGFGDFYQHMLVAEGAGEFAIDPGVNPWDIAPMLVILEEAGGRATSFAGERTIYGGSLVSTNGVLHEAALRALES